MNNKLQLMEEAHRRGILPKDKMPLFEEAIKRGLVKGGVSEQPPQQFPQQPTKGPGFIGTMSQDINLSGTEPYVRPALEYGGMTAGGVVGSGAGPAGTIGGAGLGYGIGWHEP